MNTFESRVKSIHNTDLLQILHECQTYSHKISREPSKSFFELQKRSFKHCHLSDERAITIQSRIDRFIADALPKLIEHFEDEHDFKICNILLSGSFIYSQSPKSDIDLLLILESKRNADLIFDVAQEIVLDIDYEYKKYTPAFISNNLFTGQQAIDGFFPQFRRDDGSIYSEIIVSKAFVLETLIPSYDCSIEIYTKTDPIKILVSNHHYYLMAMSFLHDAFEYIVNPSDFIRALSRMLETSLILDFYTGTGLSGRSIRVENLINNYKKEKITLATIPAGFILGEFMDLYNSLFTDLKKHRLDFMK